MMWRTAVISFALLCTVGCGDDGDDSGKGGSGALQGGGTFSAVVDGKEFMPPALWVSANLFNNSVEEVGQLTISGQKVGEDKNESEIYCFFRDDFEVGKTYNLEDTSDPLPQGGCSYTRNAPPGYSDSSNEYVVFAKSGTWTVTTYDKAAKRFEGTFSFVTEMFSDGATATITDGKFSATYRSIKL